MKHSRLFTLLLLLAALCVVVAAAPATTGMNTGKVEMKSAGPLAFGPDGVLFVGDSLGAQVVAIDTGDTKAASTGSINVTGIDSKIAAALGATADQITIRDVATNPISKNVYISVNRGRGADATAVILKLDTAGKLSEVNLDNVKYSAAALPNPPTANNQKTNTITQVRYLDGKVLVAGLSNEEFQSNLKVITFPFASAGDRGSLIEMYHGSHGRYETNSPIRTFVPYTIDNQKYILAAYTCTPLVKIPMSQLKPGAKVEGTTIAEMGAGNQPLDMVPYKKNGHDYILMANSTHGVTKLDVAHLDSYKAITAPSDIAGVPYESLSDWQNVKHLQAYDGKSVLVLSGDRGAMDLKTVALP
jgi:hypothetical protein